MRMFFFALLVMIGSGIGAYYVLNSFQKNADVAFATPGARVDPAEAPGEHHL